MPFINPAAVVEGARMVARQAQVPPISSPASSLASATSSVSSAITSAISSASSITSSAAITSAAATSSAPETTTSAAGTPGGQQSGGSSSSPLLFFVALGFGVVFTNLWIIVGVKYCFRYNARNRAMRMNGEDGEPINMENMPRPHRRRREKKLMTMDEVNEKFPMLKYKTWVASRAQEGLPTRGGVTAPPSRANSLRDVDGVVPELPSKERQSTDDKPAASAIGDTATVEPQRPQHTSKDSASSTFDPKARISTDENVPPTTSDSAATSKDENRVSQYEDDEEDEHINAALPPECMGTSGDTCAICIDQLEDDDDVRGLSCGHAFHAVCLDPWLTSRRACCPLCKADYYTPKPRPAAAEPGDATTAPTGTVIVTISSDPRTNRMNLPGRPGRTFLGIRRTIVPVAVSGQPSPTSSSGQTSPSHPPTNTSPNMLFARLRNGGHGASPASGRASAQPTASGRSGFMSNVRGALPALWNGRAHNNQTGATRTNPVVTPSNLEAATRNPIY
ncbi:hypothetical protein B0T17DRAFT_590498 [Bombardia bombarda]|uniref:RING-type domain-containing protein n=1 Tax=Bombardia bombarda TaxID=252184 RepID=A0AA39WZT2_9PEZI|nr:hypothetical protein B0T17DRAFT_590498 [Bombardia bombarda]